MKLGMYEPPFHCCLQQNPILLANILHSSMHSPFANLNLPPAYVDSCRQCQTLCMVLVP